MRIFSRLATLALSGAVGVFALTSVADAKCTRLAFSVNDYGKKGPTEDAKKLLDKYVAEWAKGKGIAKYEIGKKSVNCDLFLDVGLFDEYTCKAEASVCWGEDAGDEKPAKAKPAAEKSEAPPKKTAKKKAEKKEE